MLEYFNLDLKNASEILSEIYSSLFNKMTWNILSGKLWPLCHDLNELNYVIILVMRPEYYMINGLIGMAADALAPCITMSSVAML